MIAQSVEQRTENPCVGGSIPPRPTETSTEKSRFFFAMMRRFNYTKTYLLLALLMVYVLAQILWWARLLNEQSRLIQELQGSPFSPQVINDTQRMIIGEAAVFLLIFLGLLFLTFRSIKKELALARKQKNFLLSVSHELRTPLTTERTIIQTLLKRELPEEQKRQLLEGLLGENLRLSDLVDNVFLAQLLNSGKYSLQKQQLDLSEFLNKKLDALISMHAPGMHCERDIQDNIRWDFDPQSLETVLVNLISNAKKYAAAGEKIKVQLRKANNQIVLRFQDFGPGVAASDQKRIFDLFTRLENEETRKNKGTGLGLYICHNIVAEHGGKIYLDTNESVGCTFVMTFDYEQ